MTNKPTFCYCERRAVV